MIPKNVKSKDLHPWPQFFLSAVFFIRRLCGGVAGLPAFFLAGLLTNLSRMKTRPPFFFDSVAFDFLWAEPGWGVDTHMAGGDDYLHEAALADNPPSGTYYDPDHSGDVTRLGSLGVHEHWNNPKDKQYSRNLGAGKGVELISIKPETSTSNTSAGGSGG